MDQGLLLLIAIVVIVAMIVIWALAGSGVGSKNGESAAGQAVDDSALEFTQTATTSPLSSAARTASVRSALVSNPAAESTAPTCARGSPGHVAPSAEPSSSLGALTSARRRSACTAASTTAAP